jgi:hypothetical protein
MAINDEQLEESMIALLELSDLSTTTKKSLIQQLEAQLQMNLDEKKDLLTKILNDFVEKKSQEIHQQQDDWSDSDDEEAGDAAADEEEDDVDVDRGIKKTKKRSSKLHSSYYHYFLM